MRKVSIRLCSKRKSWAVPAFLTLRKENINGFFQIEYSSDVLGQYRQVDVIYPDRDQIAETESDTDIPVLYLLHGMGGNHNSWAFRTNIQRLLRKTNLIVIMPNSENGWYTNTKYGVRYYDAIAKELPQVMQRFFPSMTKKREKTFIAGLSMGGYGSFKLALTTNNFACAGSFSGALGLSVEMITDETSESKEYWQGVFGDLEGKDIEQHKLVNLAKQHDKKTKFFAWCGLEDFLFDSQNKAVADLKALGLDIDYRTDHGRHEWYYWEKQLEAYLEWLPIDYVKEERLS